MPASETSPETGNNRTRDDASTRLQLITTTEVLVAEHGPDAVSLRQISTAAGQGNKYAVQYHFGGKEELFQAVFAHRLPRIDEVRAELLAQADGAPDEPAVRTLLEVLLRPVALEALAPDSRYVSFVTRVCLDEFGGRSWWRDRGGPPVSDLGLAVARRITDRLDHLPEPLRHHRLRVVFGGCLTALAGLEERVCGGAAEGPTDMAGLPVDALVGDTLDSAAAALEAPLSAATRKALG